MKIYKALLICVCAVICLAGAAAAQDAGIVPVNTPLELTGLDVSGPAGHRQLRFTANPAPMGDPAADAYIGSALNRSLESFLLGLCLRDDAFWVNLTPVSAAQSIDHDVCATDTGKILLAADLALKKDTGMLTNPRKSPAGRKYWDLLYAKAAALGVEDVPIANRVWITAGPVKIRENGMSVRITESSLQICLENDYSAGHSTSFTPKQQKLHDYSMGLMRELIIPELARRVNESAAYENLRQAYRGLVLARWYKQKFGSDEPAITRSLSAGLATSFPSRLPYGLAQIYREYMDSLRQGEYDFSDNSAGRLSAYMELITRRYFSGGIDWRSTVFTKVSRTAGDNLVFTDGGFCFSITLDSRRQLPVQYAMQSIRILAPDVSPAKEKEKFGFGEDLPPLSQVDRIINVIREQGAAALRAMSRNL